MAKKKILLLSDDLRMHSGVATMSRELVLGTVHKYHWVQMAGAIKNPDSGKVMDLTQATKDMIKQGKVKSDEDVYVKLYPVDGYGNENILNAVMMQENPDAIMHFTDPRFWGWLYAIEHSIRQKVPLIFLDIWDDLPYPMYNRAFYESCDALFAISKQTDNINLWVRDPKECCRINGAYNKLGELCITREYLETLSLEAGKYSLLKMSEVSYTDPIIKDIFDKRVIEYKKYFQEYCIKKLVGLRNMEGEFIDEISLSKSFEEMWNKFDNEISSLLLPYKMEEINNKTRIIFQTHNIKNTDTNIAGSCHMKS